MKKLIQNFDQALYDKIFEFTKIDNSIDKSTGNASSAQPAPDNPRRLEPRPGGPGPLQAQNECLGFEHDRARAHPQFPEQAPALRLHREGRLAEPGISDARQPLRQSRHQAASAAIFPKVPEHLLFGSGVIRFPSVLRGTDRSSGGRPVQPAVAVPERLLAVRVDRGLRADAAAVRIWADFDDPGRAPGYSTGLLHEAGSRPEHGHVIAELLGGQYQSDHGPVLPERVPDVRHSGSGVQPHHDSSECAHDRR